MPLSPEDWHQRYLEQARWTGNIRKYLFDKSELSEAKQVLDVGIGTGALEFDFISNSHQLPTGLDINHEALIQARQNISKLNLVQGNAHQLPFKSGTFEICFCHFVLLWVSSPNQVVAEMRRVTQPGGAVIAIAEPDYGGRIDFPEDLGQIAEWQIESLKKQGADPRLGRKLLHLFIQAGLTEVEVGVIGGRWTSTQGQADWASEWKVIEADLETLHLPPESQRQVQGLKQLDASERRNGNRLLFVPTFYAWGRVSGSP